MIKVQSLDGIKIVFTYVLSRKKEMTLVSSRLLTFRYNRKIIRITNHKLTQFFF